MSRKICDLFPTETKPTYYIPYVPKENSAFSKPISAKGKLIDKYRNLQRIYKYIDNVEKIDNKDDTQQSSKILKTTFFIIFKLLYKTNFSLMSKSYALHTNFNFGQMLQNYCALFQ